MTADQAHRAMRANLDHVFTRDPAAEVAQVLSDSAILPDGRTADPAALRERLACLETALDEDKAPRRAAG